MVPLISPGCSHKGKHSLYRSIGYGDAEEKWSNSSQIWCLCVLKQDRPLLHNRSSSLHNFLLPYHGSRKLLLIQYIQDSRPQTQPSCGYMSLYNIIIFLHKGKHCFQFLVRFVETEKWLNILFTLYRVNATVQCVSSMLCGPYFALMIPLLSAFSFEKTENCFSVVYTRIISNVSWNQVQFQAIFL